MDPRPALARHAEAVINRVSIRFSTGEKPRWWDRLLLRFSNWINRDSVGHCHDGVLIIIDSSLAGLDVSAVLPKICEGLDLLREHHPACRKSVARYVRFIRVISISFDGGWGPLERCISLDDAFLMRATPTQVAYVLVHEVTHARIWWTGLPYSKALAGRIERVATGRSVAFAARMGATEDELHRLKDSAYEPTDEVIVQSAKEAVLGGDEPTWLDNMLAQVHLWFVRHSRRR